MVESHCGQWRVAGGRESKRALYGRENANSQANESAVVVASSLPRIAYS